MDDSDIRLKYKRNKELNVVKEKEKEHEDGKENRVEVVS